MKNWVAEGITSDINDFTVWSVNEGLSGNLRKPPETGLGGFRQVSVNRKNQLCTLAIRHVIVGLEFLLEICWKPVGNLRCRFPEVSGQSFIDGPHDTL